ncbi:MAG: hypothetical protein JSW27_21850 [Phycisphaerales bacterium]|nr:MAG: hypothetical protein JSW27_21850 [Phycisphaerales bacterium]
MFKSLDIKSALIGGLTVALMIASIGAVHYASEDRYDRFEMIPASGYTFLLDRLTGQVWALQNLPEGVIGATPHSAEEFYAPKIYYDADPNSPVR